MDQFQLRNEQMNHEFLHQEQQQMQEQQQQMHQGPVGQQQQMQAQAQAQQHRMPTVYERFFQNLKPLPHIPVAQALLRWRRRHRQKRKNGSRSVWKSGVRVKRKRIMQTT